MLTGWVARTQGAYSSETWGGMLGAKAISYRLSAISCQLSLLQDSENDSLDAVRDKKTNEPPRRKGRKGNAEKVMKLDPLAPNFFSSSPFPPGEPDQDQASDQQQRKKEGKMDI